MKLTKTESRLARIALRIAIDSEVAYLEAWRVAWDTRTRKPRRVIPKEERPMARKTQRRIESFHKLLKKLSVTKEQQP